VSLPYLKQACSYEALYALNWNQQILDLFVSEEQRNVSEMKKIMKLLFSQEIIFPLPENLRNIKKLCGIYYAPEVLTHSRKWGKDSTATVENLTKIQHKQFDERCREKKRADSWK
jgi:hypothetical protein